MSDLKDTLTPIEVEQVYRLVRESLAIAIYMNEAHGDTASYAAGAIIKGLHEAQLTMEGSGK